MVLCDNIITLKQYGGTCWFNSLLTAIMYSDESRKLLLEKSKTWDLSIPIFNTIAFILKNKYFRTDDKYDDYKYFEDMTPEKILTLLNEYNPEKFKFNPLTMKAGYNPEKYIQAVYNLLGVNILFLDYNSITSSYYYSRFNTFNETNVDNSLQTEYLDKASKKEVEENIKNHDLIIINHSSVRTDTHYIKYKRYKPHHLISDEIKDEINFITLKNQKYTQDSVILINHNKVKVGHAIAGIKCKGVKHVYNGWTRTTIDPAMGKRIIEKEGRIKIPCEYMMFNWRTDAQRDFKLDSEKCDLSPTNEDDFKNDLVFSFNSGVRLIIYTKVIPYKPPIILPDDKDSPPVFIDVPIPFALPSGLSVGKKVSTLQAVIRRKLVENEKNKLPNALARVKARRIIPAPDPKTDAIKKLQAIIRRKIIKKPEPVKPVPIKPPKICPEGSVLNPITNRCNKIKIPKIPKIPK